jgi:hypothetical protein
MTHIRIRASLGGNIPRMSKSSPFRVTPSYFKQYLRYSEVRAESFISPSAQARPGGREFRGYISARIYLMSHPHTQQTTLSTAKTQTADIGPPEIRPLSTISAPAIANKTAKVHPTQ